MNSRIELQEKLEKLDGVNKVYFQPPSTIKMVYPCIVYGLGGIRTLHADNILYNGTKRYSVSIIDSDPDSAIPELFLNTFKMAMFDRVYIADNLYHNVFTLYY